MSDTAWVSVSVAGSCEAKLQLLFMMYDRNHSGSLSRDEVSEIIRFVRSRSHIFGLKYQSRLLQTNPRDAMRHTRHTLSKLVSTGSIFTIFYHQMECICVNFPVFPIPQAMLPWQPILWQNLWQNYLPPALMFLSFRNGMAYRYLNVRAWTVSVSKLTTKDKNTRNAWKSLACKPARHSSF